MEYFIEYFIPARRHPDERVTKQKTLTNVLQIFEFYNFHIRGIYYNNKLYTKHSVSKNK